MLFELDRSAAAILRKNIESLKVADRCSVVVEDVFGYFASGKSQALPAASLIFLDPPYQMLRDRPNELVRLAQLFARAPHAG